MSARVRLTALALLASAAAVNARADSPEPWQFVGMQGIVQIVIVPAAQAADAAAYEAQIARLCPPSNTCFINFHTNSTGAKVELPLPDAIADEAVARFRRSMKVGQEVFQWSCRVKPGEAGCF